MLYLFWSRKYCIWMCSLYEFSPESHCVCCVSEIQALQGSEVHHQSRQVPVQNLVFAQNLVIIHIIQSDDRQILQCCVLTIEIWISASNRTLYFSKPTLRNVVYTSAICKKNILHRLLKTLQKLMRDLSILKSLQQGGPFLYKAYRLNPFLFN